jgi:SAM-dependent methyltransferase
MTATIVTVFGRIREDEETEVRMDIQEYNRKAWNRQVANANRWTVPVGPEVIAEVWKGKIELLLTPTRPVPLDWFPPLAGCRTLCLASGGGQQGPILAAAGAQVTVFDLSPSQLEQDRRVAEREGLHLNTVEGNMADLSCFADSSFDLIVHPCSNCFVPDVKVVWREAARVLRPGGLLLAGFVNPLLYIFDDFKAEQGILEVRHSIPYSDLTSITDAERQRYLDREEPLAFGHRLEDQIGGQLAAGLVLVGFYEDYYPKTPISRYIPVYIATRAIKPAHGSA